LSGELKELGGYTDKNFLLKVDPDYDHQLGRLIVKISSSLEKRQLIELQNLALQELQAQPLRCKCPALVPTALGRSMVILTQGNDSNYLRVFTYIEGE
jgi:Ser/Thr protein kinase RdoA (MazF antagonist)